MKELRNPLPSVQDICDNYYYDNGTLYRKKLSGGMRPGSPVGNLTDGGYIRGNVCGVTYYIHRVIWKMHFGTEPEQLDHINRNRSDNRIENLRECSRGENARNVNLFRTNTSGFYGISKCKDRDLYVSYVYKNNKRYSKKVKTLEIAVDIYEKLALEHHGEFAKDKIAHNRAQLLKFQP